MFVSRTKIDQPRKQRLFYSRVRLNFRKRYMSHIICGLKDEGLKLREIIVLIYPNFFTNRIRLWEKYVSRFDVAMRDSLVMQKLKRGRDGEHQALHALLIQTPLNAHVHDTCLQRTLILC